MTESKFTRCPGCATVFRITAEQLAFREGQVRCGHCRAVFDANDHFVSLDSAPPPDEFEPPEATRIEERIVADEAQHAPGIAFAESAGEAAAVPNPAGEGAAEAESNVEPEPGPPDRVASEEALTTPATGDVATSEETAKWQNLQPSVGTPTVDATAADATPADATAADATEPDATAADATAADANEPDATAADANEPDATAADATAADERTAPIGAALGGPAERFQWKKKRKLHAVPPRVYGVAAAALVVGLLLQLVLEYRDTLAAYVPATRPLLAAACKPLGCTIGPLRDGAALSIDASDLQADPAHRGLLLLSATIRNRAGHAIAFPYLELMLTDSSDRIVVRRAFPPAEYASGSADIAAGIAPNGEHVVRMFLDASATQQAGYRVYLFYP